MLLDQAIFTSSERSRIKGYHLVARTVGVDRQLAQELSRWSPSQLGEPNSQPWILSVYPVGGGRIAIARTVSSGPEYSDRGGVRVVTMICVLTAAQYAAYRFNGLLVARTALALGHLRSPMEIPFELRQPKLPDSPFASAFEEVRRPASFNVADLVRNLSQECMTLKGIEEPFDLLADLLPRLNESTRQTFSFTTGLPYNSSRPFRLHLESTAPIGATRAAGLA